MAAVRAWMVFTWSLVGLTAACSGPRPGQGPSPFAPTPPVRDAAAQRPAQRRALVGLLCAQGDARPRLHVVAAREATWRSAPAEILPTVQRGATRPFAVLSSSGGRGGVFTGIGVSDPAALEVSGGYAGAAPCRPDDAACAIARGGCMLALADLSAEGDATNEPPPLAGQTACLADGALVFDVDGDGEDEIFDAARLGALPDGLGPRLRGEPAQCKKAPFAAWPDDVTFLGALDVDGDGRVELIVRARGRVLVYAALGAPGVLQKVIDTPMVVSAP